MSTVHSQNVHALPAHRGEKIGLVAGWGRYPIIVGEALKRQGYEIVGLGIKDHADPSFAKICTEFSWVGLAKLGHSIRFFKRNGVRNATMAGKIFKTQLFERGAWWRHMPDFRGLRTFWPHFVATRKDRKDDSILLTIVNAFAEDGITMGPATKYAPELLVKNGQLTDRAPTATQWKDIEFGWQLAKEMGRLDIGQSVVVKNRAAIAIEAIEGTDECIRRAGALCSAGNFTVVKTAKPQQDMRFDVPTIGVGTLETMLAAGGKVLAVEAGKTILVDEPHFLQFANQHGMVVVAVEKEKVF